MKHLFFLTSLTLLSIKTIMAQQTRKADDGLLLQYYQNQQFKEALEYLKATYAEPVTELKELANLAYAAAMANKLTDAEGYYQRVYDADTTNLKALYNIAGINMRRGNIAKAANYYQKYNSKDSTNFFVYQQLAHIAGTQGDNYNQLIYLRKANKIDSAEASVASDLADLYIKSDSLPPAEIVLNKALIADSANIVLLQSLLALHSAQRKWKESVKTGEQLRRLGDASVTTINKLGSAYYQLKNYKTGLDILLSLGEQKTETTDYFIAVCYKELKDPKNAILYFNEAIKLSISPATSTYYNEMADSYESLSLTKTALATYKKALLYDKNPLTYYYMAALYDTKLKDKRNALKYYKIYTRSKPPKWQKGYIEYSVQRVADLGGK